MSITNTGAQTQMLRSVTAEAVDLVSIYRNPNIESDERGLTLKHVASWEGRIEKSGLVKTRAGEAMGHQFQVKVTKNRWGPAWTKASLRLLFDGGWDRSFDVFEAALGRGLVTRDPGGWSCEGVVLAQERGQAVLALDPPSALRERLEQALHAPFSGFPT